MSSKHYNANFYGGREGTIKSADILAPLIKDIFLPKSVIDVGCGLGEFLSSFESIGIDNVLGIDGEWVNTEKLQIDKSKFETRDLKKVIKKSTKFDLVICLEVAEHIEEQFADNLIETLVSLGDVVVFSAAVPYQGGTFHVNEQWPHYWAEKFDGHGFICVDYLRPKIWTNPNVKFWYKQNLIFFIKNKIIDKYPNLQQYITQPQEILPLIHPTIFTFYAKRYQKMTGWIPNWTKVLIRRFMTIPLL